MDLDDEVLVKKLLKLWRIVDFFVNDFVRHARTQQTRLIRLAELGENTSEACCFRVPQVLSKTEYSRIQRAFLHYELFRQIYGGPSGVELARHDIVTSVQHEHTKILSKYEYFELLSVREHFNSHVRRILKEVRAYAEKQAEVASSQNIECISGKLIDQEYSPRNPRFRWYHADMGLPFLFCFMHKDIVSQTVIVSEYSITHFPMPFREGERISNLQFPPKTRVKEQNILSPSQGFLELYRRGRRRLFLYVGYDLRQCGYLFWDKVHPRTERCDAFLAKNSSLNRSTLIGTHDGVEAACAVLRSNLPKLEDRAQMDKMFDDCEY